MQPDHRIVNALVGVLIGLVIGTLPACGQSSSDEPPALNPTALAESARVGVSSATIRFTEITRSGFSRRFSDLDELSYVQAISGGLAAVDIDGDWDTDLYVVGGNERPNHLYLNDGTGVFDERAATYGLDFAHWGSGPSFGDLDNDGDVDLFIGGIDGTPHRLLMNYHGRFVDTTERSGIVLESSNTVSSSIADYDHDGDLDLILAHWGSARSASSETVWQNDGTGFFVDATQSSGIDGSFISDEIDTSMNATMSDLNLDGHLDLLMAAEGATSTVYLNSGSGHFSSVDVVGAESVRGRSSSVADYDNDGDPDWFISGSPYQAFDGESSRRNRLLRNDGNGVFTDVTSAAGVAGGPWGWGACFADFDNDGLVDIFQVNSQIGSDGAADAPLRPHLFHAQADGSFIDVADAAGLPARHGDRGVVCFDADSDGRIDIFVESIGSKHITHYRNTTNTDNAFLALRFRGSATNRFAIGATVRLRTQDSLQTREVGNNAAYISQGDSSVHFGVENSDVVDIEVDWPDGSSSEFAHIAVSQHRAIEQPSTNLRLVVIAGDGDGIYDAGTEVIVFAAEPEPGYFFSHWSTSNGGYFSDIHSPQTTFTMPGGVVSIQAHYLPGVPRQAPVSVARRWNEVLMQSIRNDFARPTVHARNLFHISAAMYDAWAAYSSDASPWLLGSQQGEFSCPLDGTSIPPESRRSREIAASYVAYRLIEHRFEQAPKFDKIKRDIDSLMNALSLDPTFDSIDYAEDGDAALGNYVADCYIEFGFRDGANEINDYQNISYKPVNPALDPTKPGNPNLVDLNHWQPIILPTFIDQSGNQVDSQPDFLSPEWGHVVPFALTDDSLSVYSRDGFDYWIYHDEGPPPYVDGPRSEFYRWGFSLVSVWGSHLTTEDGVMIDISPGSVGNVDDFPSTFTDYQAFYNLTDGGDASRGRAANPTTGQPYAQQIVPRGDYTRVLAEFWADGPDSETPPGHWFVILNEISDHELFERTLGDSPQELPPLEWDVKAYFTLGGAMHDAAIAAWGMKGWYDYIRPISVIRGAAERGQSSDPQQPSYDPLGLPLIENFIELIDLGDPLAGANEEHVGKLKLYTWRGPAHIDDPLYDVAGVGWIRAEDWWPYQRPDFVTPFFAGYVSGHSTYSRAAAEVLTGLTNSPFFPGGMSEFHIKQNEFLKFEDGPSMDLTLQWATYRDASDQCSLSRIWGGIHPPADDIPGRLIGEKVGRDALRHALTYFSDTTIQSD